MSLTDNLRDMDKNLFNRSLASLNEHQDAWYKDAITQTAKEVDGVISQIIPLGEAGMYKTVMTEVYISVASSLFVSIYEKKKAKYQNDLADGKLDYLMDKTKQ